MRSLFDHTPGALPPGYRLKTLEVFNWGTFHEGSKGEQVWRVQPDGQNSLLTGANGAGKTTLVDALLALLVPTQKRFFNQSSGARSARERSEDSYVEGHYGRTQGEEQTSARIEKLRPNRAQVHSVVLGVFVSPHSVPITLVQVRAFPGGAGIQRRYLVVRAELSIAEHIRYSSDGTWLRQLKKQFPDRLDSFDSFSGYAAAFQRLFGMRDEKALTLFNHTVGMKVLGDLDEFIRANMLEESTAEEEFAKLMGKYQTLLTAYRALEKAQTQQKLLTPVQALSVSYYDLQRQQVRAERQRELLPLWLAREQVTLWSAEMARQDRELTRLERELGAREDELTATDEQRVDLETQLNTNQAAQQLKQLDKDIQGLTKSRAEKEKNLRQYNQLARGLGLPESPDAAQFTITYERAVALELELRHQGQEADEQKYSLRKTQEAHQKAAKELSAELAQLENSRSNVTGRPAFIRQELLAALGVSEEEIPFAAEVMQVRTAEKKQWGAAIEKLLHSFGLSLLVPERLYREVNAFINGHPDLKGKIVYHRVEARTPPVLFPTADSVVTKLEFNPDSPYADWVENTVAHRFDLLCTADVAIYERAEKALLPSGLQRNRQRNERDDTHHRPQLGWDNKALLREFTSKLREEQAAESKLDRALDKISKEQDHLETQQKRLSLFQDVEDYTRLDWESDAIAIARLEEQKQALEQASDALLVLRQQLTALKAHLETLGKQRDIARDAFRDTERLLKTLRQEVQEHQTLLTDAPPTDHADLQPFLADELAAFREELRYEQFAQQRTKATDALSEKLARLHRQLTEQERQIRAAMSAFRTPGAEITQQFTDWESDVRDLKAEVDQLPEYIDRYEQLRGDGLAELETRFREEFKSGVTQALAEYCDALELQHDRICDTVEHINSSLRGIAYNRNPDTYIQLVRTDSRAQEIRTFRQQQLNGWKPDLTLHQLAENPKDLEIEHFRQHVQPFIRQLQEETAWRGRVTDVRNWSAFQAREHYRADDFLKQVYESSGNLSGGEGAQLAYTVLGAAIAYQFGIDRDGGNSGAQQRSFRFIVIDEAFSKLDETKSSYLLQLCRNLGLQLMVVTPQTSIQLLEAEVAVIHWVTRGKHDPRTSVVRDIPIRVYRQDESVRAEIIAAEAAEAANSASSISE